MQASFDYERVLTPIGFTWLPIARVEIAFGNQREQLDMTCDSGSDLTLIPHQVGLSLGMRRGRAAKASLSGIAGGTPYVLKRVTLRIGPISVKCRVAWALSDDVPILLGRCDVFDRLTVTFDGRRRRVTFQK